MAYLQGVKEFNAAAKAPGQAPGYRRDPRQQHRAEQARAGQGDRAPLGLHQRRRRAAGRLDHGHAGLLERQVFQLCREEGRRGSSCSISASPRRPRLASIAKSRSVRERAGSSHASDRLVGPVPPCRRAGPGEFMTNEFWRWQACDLAQAIRTRRISQPRGGDELPCAARTRSIRASTRSSTALPDEALAAADGPIARSRRVRPLGPCTACRSQSRSMSTMPGAPTTNGVVAFKDRIAQSRQSRRRELAQGGRDHHRPNQCAAVQRALLHRQCAARPHAQSMGLRAARPAARAAARLPPLRPGLAPLAHGNDRAGSIRYPAYACGVFGLRPTLGPRSRRSSRATPEDLRITTQLTHVQGPLARSVARSAARTTAAMAARRSARSLVGAGAERDQSPAAARRARRAVRRKPGAESIPQSPPRCGRLRKWLEEAGYEVEEAAPPRFEEAARLFFTLRAQRRRSAGTTKAIERAGRRGAAARPRHPPWRTHPSSTYEGYIKAFARRAAILREWMLFFERYPLLLHAGIVAAAVPGGLRPARRRRSGAMLTAHHPMLAISMLGLPASDPTGQAEGVPSACNSSPALSRGYVLRAGRGHRGQTPPRRRLIRAFEGKRFHEPKGSQ